jgi:hypothetical protein
VVRRCVGRSGAGRLRTGSCGGSTGRRTSMEAPTRGRNQRICSHDSRLSDRSERSLTYVRPSVSGSTTAARTAPMAAARLAGFSSRRSTPRRSSSPTTATTRAEVAPAMRVSGEYSRCLLPSSTQTLAEWSVSLANIRTWNLLSRCSPPSRVGAITARLPVRRRGDGGHRLPPPPPPLGRKLNVALLLYWSFWKAV